MCAQLILDKRSLLLWLLTGTGWNGMERGREGKRDLTEGVLSYGFDFGTMHKHTLFCTLTLFTQWHILAITREQFIKIFLVPLSSCIVLHSTDVLSFLLSSSLFIENWAVSRLLLLITNGAVIHSFLLVILHIFVSGSVWKILRRGIAVSKVKAHVLLLDIPDSRSLSWQLVIPSFAFQPVCMNMLALPLPHQQNTFSNFWIFLSVWPGEKVSWF